MPDGIGCGVMASARLRHILACIDPAASESLSVSLSSLIVSFTAARTDVDPLDPFGTLIATTVLTPPTCSTDARGYG